MSRNRGYATHLDNYILFCFVVMFALGLEHALVKYLSGVDRKDDAALVDQWVAIGFGSFVFAFHVVYALAIIHIIRRSRRHMPPLAKFFVEMESK